jgi:hypothetical protein
LRREGEAVVVVLGLLGANSEYDDLFYTIFYA